MSNAIELLKRFVDVNDDECRLDHKGYCQEHYLEPGDECMVKQAKDLIRAFGRQYHGTPVEEVRELSVGTLNDIVREAHAMAREKGFWDGDAKKSPLECHMLIVSEIAEASEEVRNGTDSVYLNADGKPDGEAVELADAVIRIADYFGAMGWNLEEVIRAKMEYNRSRPHLHGKKK